MTTNKLLKITFCSIFLCLFNYSRGQDLEKPKNIADKKAITYTDTLENKGIEELTNNYVVEYDFSTGLYNKNTLKPKVHFPMIYRIKNINRFAYKIDVKSKDSVLAFSFSLEGLSKEILAIKKSEQESTESTIDESPKSAPSINSGDIKDAAKHTADNKKELAEVLNSTVQILDLNKQIATDTEKLKKISDDINNNMLMMRMLEQTVSQVSAVKDSIKSQRIVLLGLNELSEEQLAKVERLRNMEKILEDEIRLKQEETRVKENLKKLEKDKVINEALQTALTSFQNENIKLGELFSKFRQSFRQVNKINQRYDELCELISHHQLTYEKAKEKVKLFREREKNEFPDYQNEIAILKSKYYDIQVQYAILKNNVINESLNDSGKSKLYGQANDYIDRAKIMFEKINLTDVQKKMNLMPMIINSLDSEDTFMWKSSPVEPIGDVVSFHVDIKAKNKTENKILDERKFRHQEFTYGGTRIDFGLGLAASYFSDTPVYELQVEKIDSLSKITIREKSKQLIVPSLIGLATMSYRTSQYICYGGSAGLGIAVVNGKIQLSNFFAGPTITFGRYERLSFTAGASLRNVQQLKSGYEVGSSVTETSDDIENYLTDKYKVGFFASLTFVLTKGMKENLNKISTYR